MKWAKKMLLFVLLMTLPVTLGGCWDNIEVRELGVVMGIGLDYEEGEEPIQLTLQMVAPSGKQSEEGQSGGNKKYETYTVHGQTVFDAYQNMQKTSPKRTVLPHSKLVVIGKKLAEQGLTEVSDFLVREREVRPTSWIVVSDSTAREILESELGTGSIPAAGLVTMQENFLRSSTGNPINLIQFFMRMQGDAKAAVTPIIKKTGEHIQFEQSALFRRDRMIGTLSLNETRGLMWLESKVESGNVTLPFQNEGVKLQKNVSVEISRGHTNITPHFDGRDEITMDIRCKGWAQIRDTELANKILFSSQQIERLETAVETQLEERIQHTIDIARQKYKTDFLGFNNKFHNRYPQAWKSIGKDWDEIFPSIRTNLAVDIEIVRQGITKNPPVNED
ncbi:Ger(x)C family spore germination protein [Paenibacillus puldeungensis]|uniref:Ger(X)C family spore germination protein n=1 Tax=Paenibacillus puldeungensis TaxID=696536 RepID=A0ABW3RZE2_9BACL